jgi:hypothetical protein
LPKGVKHNSKRLSTFIVLPLPKITGKRIHKNPLKPAKLAGLKSGNFGKIKLPSVEASETAKAIFTELGRILLSNFDRLDFNLLLNLDAANQKPKQKPYIRNKRCQG